MENPINFYSVIHFIEYGILALHPAITSMHVLFISILWELIELVLPYHWARESILNKVFDIFFSIFLAFTVSGYFYKY